MGDIPNGDDEFILDRVDLIGSQLRFKRIENEPQFIRMLSNTDEFNKWIFGLDRFLWITGVDTPDIENEPGRSIQLESIIVLNFSIADDMEGNEILFRFD